MSVLRKLNGVTGSMPRIVSREEWNASREAILLKEKAATRARDALAAERRRLPMWKVEKEYLLQGPLGTTDFVELFEGRSQLIVYQFMFGVEWDEGCVGCSMMVDNMGNPAHLHARDVSFALVSRAPYSKIDGFKKRMGWTLPWYSADGCDYMDDFEERSSHSGTDGEFFGLSVFLKEGADVYQTYYTGHRGMEQLGSNFSYLDLVPYGRQEKWEDSPAGWPETEPYQWWRYHDKYSEEKKECGCIG